MTQRIFDVENEKDMADLWDILPNGIKKISPNYSYNETSLYADVNFIRIPIGLIKINWHDKTEITRPIKEATEANYQIELMEYVLNTLQAVLNFERDFIAKNQKLFQ